jgi:DNA-binding NarL/FixJ family response regulator
MARRGRPPYPGLLTPRQQEVLELVRQGLTNPQIAERLGISTDAAKFHVSEIITRLGVTSRREAASRERTEAPSARLWSLGGRAWRIRRGTRRLRRHRVRVMA